MGPIKTYTFEGTTSKLVPYTGPFHKVRPVIKWIIIAYFVIILGVSTLILHEQTIGEFLRRSILPYFAVAWLIKTRARREEIAEPIEVNFHETGFSVVKPQTPVRKGRGEVPRRDVFSMEYGEVTGIRYDLGLKLVVISGRLHSEFFGYAGEDRPGVPPLKEKTVDDAAAFWYTHYMNPALNEEILAMLAERTGKEVDRFGT